MNVIEEVAKSLKKLRRIIEEVAKNHRRSCEDISKVNHKNNNFCSKTSSSIPLHFQLKIQGWIFDTVAYMTKGFKTEHGKHHSGLAVLAVENITSWYGGCHCFYNNEASLAPVS